MIRNIKKRLQALEAKIESLTGGAILYFADGSIVELRGRPNFLVHLYGCLFDNREAGSMEARQLDLIRQSIASRELGGAHMVELIRAMQHGPAELPKSGGQQSGGTPRD